MFSSFNITRAGWESACGSDESFKKSSHRVRFFFLTIHFLLFTSAFEQISQLLRLLTLTKAYFYCFLHISSFDFTSIYFCCDVLSVRHLLYSHSPQLQPLILPISSNVALRYG